MRDFGVASPCLVITLILTVSAAVGCGPLEGELASSPLSNAELASSSSIFIESEQYQLKTVSTETDEKIAPTTESKPEQNPKSSPKTSQKKKSKPKAKSKSVDIDFVLTKSKDISVGVALPLNSGESSRVQNETLTFVPASIVKLVTTAVALKVLGPDFRFSTRVLFDLDSNGQANGVVLLADGDPTAGVTTYEAGAPNRMRDIALQLKSRGVRKIVGEIAMIAVDPRWDAPVLAPGVPDEDTRQCYGSFVTSFNFQGNCADVIVYSHRAFKWESPGIDSFISTRVDTSAGSSNSLRLSSVISPDRRLQGYALTGTYIAKKPRVLKYRLPVGNGAAFYANELRSALKAAGIGVDQADFNFSSPSGRRSQAIERIASEKSNVLQIESAPLAEIVLATNKSSDNFFADALFRMVGTRGSQHSSVNSVDLNEIGKSVLSGFLNRWLAADGNSRLSDEIFIVDGAGLSSQNRATPRSLLALLRQFAKEATFGVLWSSLSVAGQDGTLGDRMKNTRATGRVRGKTGTLNGTYQVAGYVQRKNTNGSSTEDAYVPFVILTSTTAKNRDLVRRFQDALIVKIVEAVDRGDSVPLPPVTQSRAQSRN